MANQEMTAKKRILKEGILQKKSSVLKQWRTRFVVLNRQMLCMFKKEDDEKRGRTAEGRIFVMDIESIENYESKKKKHCFSLIVEGRLHTFCCSSELDRELWIRSVQTAKDNELKEEETDPVRRKSTKLTGGLKRITIPRVKGQGLGCTIKDVGGVIFVNRILEDGPVSTSGILRPGDQILDINGIEIGGRSVSEISEIIKASPDVVVCTVKPSSDFRYCDTHEQVYTDYAEIDLALLKAKEEKEHSRNNESNSFKPGESDDERGSSSVDQKRHSLPDSFSKAGVIRNREGSLNYLELNFPPNERPRGRSDVVRTSPRVQYRRTKEQTTPGSYIELEFQSRDKKQEPANSSKAGDVKSVSLPWH